ncbi:sigma-70 family RNA polymerase sigma factor [Streptomyces zingiberis]|uniref:Sigma-70 family RNA polymerase sigma factor n=1 Tax=Streptomyces zingiberis TaxID=2053010 RepID=A0ABX1BQ97_9ACTN|nr:sigma-70 family RNA polymerase sigma factor [Streptomyces zingiberis]NJP99909.1 sigma-70 family RNA polymerase sigma factor [Streptomyces zingiberis]
MQQRLARGEAAALGELYDRFASLVHGLAYRVLGEEGEADRVTREVFAHLWEHPESYDVKQGPMRSWVAALAQRRSVQRLRATEAELMRTAGGRTPDEVERKIHTAARAARADYIVTSMPAPLRDALELAYFRRRDYREAAADLGVTEDEARRRLRLGLQLLSSAEHRPTGQDTPGHHRAGHGAGGHRAGGAPAAGHRRSP